MSATRVAGLLVVAFGVAACATPEATPSAPATATTTAAARTLDASAYNDNDKICDLLPGADAGRLGYVDWGIWQPEGVRKYDSSDYPATISCRRDGRPVPNDRDTWGFGVATYLYLSTDVTAAGYQSDQDYVAVDTIKVRGQTGIVRRIADRPQVKYCEVDVELDKSSGFVVEVDGLGPAKACASAKAVAEAVVNNLSR
ncbi:DUF3558 family protein [Labedaea rhizosphaerae]|uniref:Uncharacterized protein DUF3558 n=1 Tax=Labedaea rhizosphaerae TaxID=598644 RepID=A0A4R6SQZ7_LABRH|nr:DUF3558 family protein [Labedaea rhizosphaerae]TDQ05703.1 uncharacterized protein DUF3558 [Labedaea rhizosphaerae]